MVMMKSRCVISSLYDRVEYVPLFRKSDKYLLPTELFVR